MLFIKRLVLPAEVAGEELRVVALPVESVLLLPGKLLVGGGVLVGEESVMFLVSVEVKGMTVDAGVSEVPAELASVVLACFEVAEVIVVVMLLECGVLVIKVVVFLISVTDVVAV